MNSNHIREIKKFTKKVWGTNPAGWAHAQDKQKGTQAFFEKVLTKRSTQELPWLPEVVQFENYTGKKVLEIGCGAGYDAYAFCKAGAQYVGIDLVPENIVLSKAHLALYGFNPLIEELDAENMEFKDSFDLIYSFGVLHHIPRVERVIEKSYQALKSGGIVCFIVYYKYSIVYLRIILNWLLRRRFLRETLQDALSCVEDVGSSERPLVRVYSKKEFCSLLVQAGFKINNVKIRKLERQDLIQIRIVWRFYKYIPQWLLDKISHWWGWYLCVKATKE